MSWRESLLRSLAPGLFAGVSFGDWLAVLRENHFAIDPRYWLRATCTSLNSLANSVSRWYEDRMYGPRVQGVSIPPPLFILGHWRSGTTHLQNLLALDPRFATPTFYQTPAPYTFLTTEAVGARLGNFFLPRTRLVDNMAHNFGTPYEDEFAACVTTRCSPYLTWAFPRRADHYDRYLTFREVPEAEVVKWKEALLRFFKKLTWKYGRPLVLKSPPHTARIKLLLAMFPEARFVHIHRNPYVVFQSTKHLNLFAQPFYAFQRCDAQRLEARILRQYREMYDAFFEERGLIPKGHFHEVGFEDLEHDPVQNMQTLYEALALSDFNVVEGPLRRYVESLAGYRKNTFPELSVELRQRIARDWRRGFEEWGYPV